MVPTPAKVRVRVSGVLGRGDQRLASWPGLLRLGDGLPFVRVRTSWINLGIGI
jgi:hypothetical protein